MASKAIAFNLCLIMDVTTSLSFIKACANMGVKQVFTGYKNPDCGFIVRLILSKVADFIPIGMTIRWINLYTAIIIGDFTA